MAEHNYDIQELCFRADTRSHCKKFPKYQNFFSHETIQSTGRFYWPTSL